MATSGRYEPVSTSDETDHIQSPPVVPASPPPPFSSRPSSPLNPLLSHDPLVEDEDRTLEEAFGSPSDDEDDENETTDQQERRRLVQRQDTASTVQTRVIQYPAFAPTTSRLYGTGRANDGVFANLSAKPSQTDEADEKPPSYEQAAADSAPPYWETTVLAPGLFSDEVYVDGLPVGSVFSFIWNGMISTSFQVVGFLLTYLLHTTHAAKNGSRAGLGITLVQYGFSMKGASNIGKGSDASGAPDSVAGFTGTPADPNTFDFDPVAEANSASFEQGINGGLGAITSSDWFAYILMIIGWFILIRAVGDFLRARRHEQLVLQSPDRGLPVPIIAEGEQPEAAV